MTAQTFNPEAAQEKTNAALTMLEQGIANLTTGEKWTQYLATQAQFHHYSSSNAFLIMLQNPDATKVAGFETWKRLGRFVKKGEKGMFILAPCAGAFRIELEKYTDPRTGEEKERQHKVWTQPNRFRIVYVFDVSQTEGKELVTAGSFCNDIAGDTMGDLYDRLAAFAAKRGNKLDLTDTGDPRCLGYFMPSTGEIVVRPDLSPDQQAKTLTHELAHAILHANEADRAALDRPQLELEAESTAYVVMSALGFDTSAYSFGYVATWAWEKDFAKELKQSAGRIQKAAAEILSAIQPATAQEQPAA